MMPKGRQVQGLGWWLGINPTLGSPGQGRGRPWMEGTCGPSPVGGQQVPWPVASSPKVLPLQGLTAAPSGQNSEGLKVRPPPRGNGWEGREFPPGEVTPLHPGSTHPGAEPSSTGATR